MDNKELEQLIKTVAEPHLVGSAKEATKLTADLNSHLSHLRLEVSSLELRADLELNKMVKEKNQGFEKTKAEWKTTELYREWQTKKGLLSDLRAVKRNLERHKDLLIQQEMFRPRSLPSGGERYGE